MLPCRLTPVQVQRRGARMQAFWLLQEGRLLSVGPGAPSGGRFLGQVKFLKTVLSLLHISIYQQTLGGVSLPRKALK